MSGINMSSIMSKVKAYTKSDAGQVKIAKAIKERRESGNGRLASGDYIVTLEDMERMAIELIRTLKDEASSAANNLPQSVLDHFDSLTYTRPSPTGKEGKQYGIDIYFKDDLSRMSLLITSGDKKGQRTGEGIRNIVSLYDTGYQASDMVYGIWNGHEKEGVIASRTELQGRYFIERAIDSFNRKYGERYNLLARVTASPEFYGNFNF